MTQVPLRYTGGDYAAVFRTVSDEFWDYYIKVYLSSEEMRRDIVARHNAVHDVPISDFRTADCPIAVFEHINSRFTLELVRTVNTLKQAARILPKTVLTLDDVLTAAPLAEQPDG